MSEAIRQEIQRQRGHLAKLKVNMAEHAAWRGAKTQSRWNPISASIIPAAPLSSNSAGSVEPTHGDRVPGRNA